MKKDRQKVLVPLIYDNTDVHLCTKLEYSWMFTASRVTHSRDGLPSLSRILFFFFCGAAGHGLLILEVFRSHTTTHHSR